MKRKRKNTQQKRILRLCRAFAIGMFALIMAVESFTGLLFFVRPGISKLENRTLTSFPAMSWNGFWNGSWFSDIGLWYADTFPGRETLVAAANDFRSLYGVKSSVQMIGGKNASQVQEIPSADNNDNPKDDQKKDPDKKVENPYDQIELPQNFDAAAEVQNQIMQGTLIVDGSAYGIYYYVDEAAQAYIQMINDTAKELEGVTKVYSALIPNNSGVVLDDEIAQGSGGSDQVQAIHYYYTRYNDDVVPINTIDTLRDHRDEYLYFHSDHHWTALGAYYVYVSFCQAKGIEPHSLEEFQQASFSPFLGSSRTVSSDLLTDTLTGYVPMGTNTIKIFNPVGEYVPLDLNNPNTYEAEVFNTGDGYDEVSQYLRFIAGDRGLSQIHNPIITDGSSCVVIKESYGNAFVPFLVDHYEDVYVIDWRYADGSVIDFCRENEIDDLIFANNIQIIGSPTVVADIAAMMKPGKTSAPDGQTDDNKTVQKKEK